MSIELSANVVPTGTTVNITATARSPSAGYLYLVAHEGSGDCAASASAEWNQPKRWYILYVELFNLPYTAHKTFTPSAPGTYRVCGYFTYDPIYPNGSTATALIEAQGPPPPPTADPVALSVALSDGLVHPGRQVIVKASGVVDHPTRLSLFAHPTDSNCGVSVTEEEAVPDSIALISWEDIGGETIGEKQTVGYSEQRTLTPQILVPYRICAYLTDYNFDAAHVIATATLDSPDPGEVAVRLRPKRPLVPSGQKLAVTVSGTSPSGLFTLWAFAQVGRSACRATPAEESRARKAKVKAILHEPVADRFSHRVSVTPKIMGTSKVCSYLGLDRTDTDYLETDSVTFRVGPPALKRLSVEAKAHRGATKKHPGRTNFTVRSVSQGAINFGVWWEGRFVGRLVKGLGYLHGVDKFHVNWNCDESGQHRYVVTVRDRYGHKRTKAGRFRTLGCAGLPAHRRHGGGGGGGATRDCGYYLGVHLSAYSYDGSLGCVTAQRVYYTYAAGDDPGWDCFGTPAKGACYGGLALADYIIRWHR